MFAVATSILPHMSSTRSRRVSNARLFVGAAASVRLSRAPHFSGGDEHPAALGQAVFFQQWRRATCLAARPTPKTSKKASGYCSDPCCVKMHLSCLKSLRSDCRWRQTLCRLCFTNMGKNQCDTDADISQGLDCLSQKSS